MPVTIRDVAKQLNLSITTVSRALDGYSDVAEETRDLVKRTANEMGYVPNRAARQLRRKRSDALGYILPAGFPRFSEAFFSDFIAGLGDETALNQLDLLISTASPGESEQQMYRRWVQERKVDGLILNRVRLQDWRVDFLCQENFPFSTLERSLNPGNYPSIEVDGRKGIHTLIDHLVRKGHRRIAYIGGQEELKIQTERFSGYREGLASAGIQFDDALTANQNISRQDGYQATQKLLNLADPPTAIVCINDVVALGAMRAGQEKGLVVGRDLAVAGFDDTEEARQAQPALTTLRQPVYQIARDLVRLLVARIVEGTVEGTQMRLFPELIIRESTG
jgi:DNA-binding LacI/PurR family transcriptional regulator